MTTCDFCFNNRHYKCRGCGCSVCAERKPQLTEPPPPKPKPEPKPSFKPTWNPDTGKWSFAKDPRVRAKSG